MLLQLAGLRVRSDSDREPRLGVSTSTDSNGVSITELSPAGAAEAAGAKDGDRFVTIGDVNILNDD